MRRIYMEWSIVLWVTLIALVFRGGCWWVELLAIVGAGRSGGLMNMSCWRWVACCVNCWVAGLILCELLGLLAVGLVE